MPKKQGRKSLTKHAVMRGNQRLGVNANGLSAMAERARRDGLGWQDTAGELRTMLSSRSIHGCTAKYYANAVYVFGKGYVLVTVLNIGTSFDKDLYKYTTYPVFVTYKQNRYKFAKDKTKMNQEIAVGTEFYKNKIIELAAPNEVKIKCIKALPHKQYNLCVTSAVLHYEITDRIKAETGLDVEYINEYYCRDEEMQSLKADIRKWIFIKVAMSPKIKYIDDQTVRIQVKTMHEKIRIKDTLPVLFEKEFHRQLCVEVKGSKTE